MSQDAFLASLFQKLPPPDSSLAVAAGDDCAAISTGQDNLILLAVDQIIGGRHYFDHNSPEGSPPAPPPELIGRKLLARNLSDIAAMGGVPTYCLTAMALAERHYQPEQWLDRFFAGLLALAAEYQVQMIGGDLATSCSEDIASLTIVGSVPASQVCRRRGAAAGDALFATGCFGDALNSEHHLHFTPRCREGAWLAEQGLARAMIDVSDGLLLDGLRIAQASQLSIRMNLETIPLRNPARPLPQAISDGEDYELLFAVPGKETKRLINNWPFPVKLTRIGEFIDRQPASIIDEHDNALEQKNKLGYDLWPSWLFPESSDILAKCVQTAEREA